MYVIIYSMCARAWKGFVGGRLPIVLEREAEGDFADTVGMAAPAAGLAALGPPI
jgi:hypothetical protein